MSFELSQLVLPLKIFVQMSEQLPRWDNPISNHQHDLVWWVWKDPLKALCCWERSACTPAHLTQTMRCCQCQNSKYHCSENERRQINELAIWNTSIAINHLAVVIIEWMRNLLRSRSSPWHRITMYSFLYVRASLWVNKLPCLHLNLCFLPKHFLFAFM